MAPVHRKIVRLKIHIILLSDSKVLQGNIHLYADDTVIYFPKAADHLVSTETCSQCR